MTTSDIKPAQRSQSASALYSQLRQPFDLKFLKVRIGAKSKKKDKAIPLFFLDAREVRKRLTEVCGLEGWSSHEEPVVSGGKLFGVKCELSIKMPYKSVKGVDVWNTKTDFGEPSNTAPLKGAASDALKRAAVNFGVGTYLYYIPNVWLPINEYNQFESDPKEWLQKNCSWAIPNDNAVEDWENVAIMEYQPENDIDLETLVADELAQYEDAEAERILKNAQEKRAEIIKAAKKAKENKEND